MSTKEKKMAILKSIIGKAEDSDSLLDQDSARIMKREEDAELPFSDAVLDQFLSKIKASNVVQLPLLERRDIIGERLTFTPMAAGTDEETDSFTRDQRVSLGALGNATIELSFATDPFDKVTLLTLCIKLDTASLEDMQIACFPRSSDSPLMICKLTKGENNAQVSKRFDPEQGQILKGLDWDFGIVNE